MRANRHPEEVFTPNAIVVQEMFQRRNEPDRFGNPGLQDRVVEGLRQIGAQLRVFGDTGVGKTSLLTFAAMEVKKRPLVVTCRSSQDYGDLLEEAITQIHGVRLSSYVKHRQGSVDVEAQGGWKFLASIRGRVSGSAGTDRTFEIVDKSPLDLLLILMRDKDYSLLVLDNFQNVTDVATRTEVAQTIEVLSDRAASADDIKLVVIGIAEDARALLPPSGSTRRRTVDIGVPRMPDDEIRAILRAGFRLLDLEIEVSLLDHVVYFCDGFPYFTHAIGLNISRAARADRATRVSSGHVAAGLLRTVNEVDETYARRLRMARERAGAVQPKKQLLDLMARSKDREWTCRDARRLWQREHRSDERKLQFIDAAMGALVREKNGAVLARDESTSPYRYRFSDPHFRTLIRIQADLGDFAQRDAYASGRRPEGPPEIFRDSFT